MAISFADELAPMGPQVPKQIRALHALREAK
jgi:hypothetical protein